MPAETILAGTGAIGGNVANIIAGNKAAQHEERARREQMAFEREKYDKGIALERERAQMQYQQDLNRYASQVALWRRYGIDLAPGQSQVGGGMTLGGMAGIKPQGAAMGDGMEPEEEAEAPLTLPGFNQ